MKKREEDDLVTKFLNLKSPGNQIEFENIDFVSNSLMIFKVFAGNLRKFAPRLEEIEEEGGRREEERKVINSSVEEEEEEEGSGKRMMGSFHSSASSGSSTLDMMGRVVREGKSKEERRGRSKHQVTSSNILFL